MRRVRITVELGEEPKRYAPYEPKATVVLEFTEGTVGPSSCGEFVEDAVRQYLSRPEVAELPAWGPEHGDPDEHVSDEF